MSRLVPYLVSAAAVAVVGFAAHVLTRFVPLPHVSILFLAAVVTSAALWGFWPSVFAAVLSVAAGSYFFYSPVFSFRVANLQDLADLAVFVIVAALTSRLAASVRAQALEAERRRDLVARLLASSERLAAAASDAELDAAIRASLAGAAPGEDEYVRAVQGQAALARERARLRREVAEARVRMQGEMLREALLNSVSHDLQTPLAAILGSATTLESLGEAPEGRARRELVATIREEAERLESYIGNLLDLGRIRAGQLAPRLELVELADIVDAALRRKQKALAGREVRVALPADLPMLELDLFLMEHALANVLDNAAKYTAPGSRLDIAARVEPGSVVLEVTDRGSGIRAEDLERVFEPFYRGQAPGRSPDAGPPGTGLGLAICRAFVEANRGSVEALSAATGATLRLRLPIPQRVAAAEGALSDD